MNNINCITKEVHIFELTIAGLATDWEKGKYTRHRGCLDEWRIHIINAIEILLQ